LPRTVTSFRDFGERSRTARLPTAAAGAALLVHAAAIGMLLRFSAPAPFAARDELIEVSVITEADETRSPASNQSDAISGHQPDRAGASARDAGRVFDVPLPAPGFRTRPPALDVLGALRDCSAVESARRDVSRHPRLGPPPCVSADLALRLPALVLPTDEPDRNGRVARADDDYKTFKPDPSPFDGSLFPDKPPPGNGALKRWLLGLFR
jgi:hypothetical protein